MKYFLLLLVLCSTTIQASNIKYDKWFKQYNEMYRPLIDWRLMKAQCMAESNLNPLAVSPVNAQGICQFMPATWSDTERALKLDGNPFHPELNIQFASFYMMKQEKFWKSERPAADRTSLAMASYNAGAGHLVKAQRKCGGGNLYVEIIPCLERVTGHHSVETINYVKRIWRNYIEMVYGI